MTLYRPMALLAMTCLLASCMPRLCVAQSSQPSGETMTTSETAVPGLHDFDFLVGQWQVRHRRLKERLANSHEWIEFDGTSVTQKVMDGYALVDDNVLEFPPGGYRAAGLRSFDVKSGQWSIWWLDGRTPLGPMDPPVRGRFQDGTGTFLADETFNGIPIRVRFTWSAITPTSCHWEQAFSTDGGATWEMNWAMDFERVR
jgi:hypothetical protein